MTVHYEPKCVSCHDARTPAPIAAASAKGAMHHDPAAAGGPSAVSRRPPTCPINPTSGCIDCHMPKVADPSLKMRFTDHHIRIHREPAAARAGGG